MITLEHASIEKPLSLNLPAPRITIDKKIFEHRSTLDVVEIDVVLEDGTISRFFLDLRLTGGGRPVLTTTAKLNESRETTKSVAGAFAIKVAKMP
jgi:hypothetical protein